MMTFFHTGAGLGARSALTTVALMFALVHPAAAQSANMIADGSFEAGADAFWASGGVTLSREGGRLCASVPAGGQPWERLIGVNDITLSPGQGYSLSMLLSSESALTVPVLVQRGVEPWVAQAKLSARPLPVGAEVSTLFRASEADPAQVIFHLGGQPTDWRLCLDDIVLTESEAAVDEAAQSSTTGGPTIRINQHGYLADGPKRATLVSGAPEPLPFQVINAEGRVVAKGQTVPMGYDASAGLDVHVADFSGLRTVGSGYKIVSGEMESHAFPIESSLYGPLRVDALSFFYPQRSGVEILGEIAGAAYGRPAGHIGISPNQGDTDVGCLDGDAAAALYGPDWTCDYRLDVSGGWYDAGDQGKYVVNGGIAVAQLMATFERGISYGGGSSAVTSDSLARIPENGNGVPDILDEARFELEFLLKMQVPKGQTLAGMAHHSVHDRRWTGVPMLPHLDPEERALTRPSTAATLNLAAAAAQGARLFRPFDAAFADRLLSASRLAFEAAAAHPDLFAPQTDGLQGGGDYHDDDISDETYWAAAELFITTGEDSYLDALRASPHWAGAVFSEIGAFDWRSTAGLARLQLALFANDLPEDDRRIIRDSVISAARNFVARQANEPMGHIYRPANNEYNWGSNQLILQNMIVVSAAFDLTGEGAFLAGVRESMDYILGRNAMNISYITGYGTVSSQNQHSRWYAHQVDPSLPNPPKGSLAGGPNTALVDDIGRERLVGCAPQQCYVDDIMSYGTNEITVNWNAPLVYVASFLADAQ